jgi:hypothetical protein
MVTSNALELQGALAIFVPILLQWVKGASWFPWINAQSAKLNALAGAVLASLAVAGIHFSWDTTTHTAALSGLTLSAVLVWLGAVAKQYLFQHAAYRLMYGPATPKP